MGASINDIVDLRPWMDQTPITLPAKSSLMLTVGLFQKLGLRYILFAYHGQLQGLLTKKDAWFILNSARDDVDRNLAARERTGEGASLLDAREDRSLLHDDDASSMGMSSPTT